MEPAKIEERKMSSKEESTCSQNGCDIESFETEPYVPPKISNTYFYALIATFCVVIILDSIFIELGTVPVPVSSNTITEVYTPWLAGLGDALDACVRTVIFSLLILIPWKQDYYSKIPFFTAIKNLTFANWFKLIFARMLCQASLCMDVMCITYLSGGTQSVLKQIKIAIVAVLRYFYSGETLSKNQFLFITVIMFNAISWRANDFWGNAGKQFVIGIVCCAISLLTMSLDEVILENVMKYDLKELPLVNKQHLIALIDVPIAITFLYVSIYVDITVAGLPRTWNIFQGFDFWCGIRVVNCFVWAVVTYTILFYKDAIWLNLTFVCAMGLIWPIELGLRHYGIYPSANEFELAKVFILIALMGALLGYECECQEKEKNQEKKNLRSYSFSYNFAGKDFTPQKGFTAQTE